MSGHSKWATIKRQKGVNDAKRGVIFTKLGNQIAIAARSGIDPTTNPSLAMAIEKAKSANMPLSNIERAIQRVADKNAAILEEVTYEGYGPGGVAIIVEAATDNKNRTYPEVRHAFSKHGGSMAEPGAVMFQFTRKGVIRAIFSGDPDETLLAILDAGAEDAQIDGHDITIFTEAKALHAVRSALPVGVVVSEAELSFEPNTTVPMTDAETERKLMNLLHALDDLDDVVTVATNADLG